MTAQSWRLGDVEASAKINLCHEWRLPKRRAWIPVPRFKTCFHILQALAAFFRYLPSPASWRPPVVERVARTLVFAGVDALPPLLLTGAGLGELARRYCST